MIHPALMAAVALLIGTLSARLGTPALVACPLLLLTLTAWLWRRGHRPSRAWLFALALLALGLVRGAQPDPEPLPPTQLRDRLAHTITGTIARPARAARDRFRLLLQDVQIDHRPFPAKLRLSLPASALRPFTPGQPLTAQGRVHALHPATNPGVRDPLATLVRRGILATASVHGPADLSPNPLSPNPAPASLISRLRETFRRLSRATLPRRTAWLEAIVLGDSAALRPAQRAPWRDAGMAHLLAISGLHVGLVALAVYRLFFLLFARLAPWSRRFCAQPPAALAATLAAWSYVAVAAAPLSAVRAAWMVTGLSLGVLIARGRDLTTALSLAFILVLAQDPGALTDPSFQLSFSAVLALAFGMPGIEIRLADPAAPALRHRLLPLIRLIAASTLATLGTLPFVIWHFQAVPSVGILVNIVAIPLVGWLVVLPALLALTATALHLPALATLILRLCNLGLAGADHLAQWASARAHPIPTLGVVGWEIALVATGALLLIAASRMRTRRGTRRLLLIGALLMALPALARLPPTSPNPRLRLTFLAVGHGDATLIQTPDGHNILVDGGGDPLGRRDIGRRTVLPALTALGVQHIHLMVVSHAHPDHFAGLVPIAQSLPVDELWWTGQPTGDPRLAQLVQIVQQRGGLIRAPNQLTIQQHIGQTELQLLYPRPPIGNWYGDFGANNNSIVIRIRLGHISALLTGDIERPAERLLVDRYGGALASTVLKVPHHGSHTSSSERFLDTVHPRFAVVESADHGQFLLPHPDIEARYRARKIPFWVTGRSGAVQFSTDGDTFFWSRP